MYLGVCFLPLLLLLLLLLPLLLLLLSLTLSFTISPFRPLISLPFFMPSPSPLYPDLSLHLSSFYSNLSLMDSKLNTILPFTPFYFTPSVTLSLSPQYSLPFCPSFSHVAALIPPSGFVTVPLKKPCEKEEHNRYK